MGSERNPDDTMKILVATDIHLGYKETDPIRGDDSFVTFEEILSIGRDRDVDFIILGGDLFHDNKPSMNSIHRCLALLRKYCMGDKPVAVEFLSDQDEIFKHCPCRNVNYEDPNLNIAIPVFSIHGNHDDPCGLNTLGSMDVVCSTGLINYFSKWTDLSQVRLTPLLMRKGSTKMCLYGLSHIKDERLARLFKEKKVLFERPSENPNSWCSILVLHQNRVDRGINKYIKEEMLPNFLQMVIWGHEHECRVEPEYNHERGFRVIQPGSSVATSLSDGESVEKKVAILSVNGVDTFVEPVSLNTVRPFVFDTLVLRKCNLPGVENRQNEVIAYVQEHVDNMISRASGMLTGDSRQPHLPLIKLRIDYNNEADYFNTIRFGQMYIDKVADPTKLIDLQREKSGPRSKKGEVFDQTTMDSVVNSRNNDTEDIGSKVEKVIEDYFKEENNTKPLKVLSVRGMNEAVSRFVEKDDKDAFKAIIQFQRKKTLEYLKKLDEIDENNIDDFITNFTTSRANKSQQEEEKELKDYLDDEDSRISVSGLGEDNINGGGVDIDDIGVSPPRKRGRGSRGGSRGSRGGSRAKPTSSSARNFYNGDEDERTGEMGSDDDTSSYKSANSKFSTGMKMKSSNKDSDDDLMDVSDSDERNLTSSNRSTRGSGATSRGGRGSRARGSTSGTRGRGARGGNTTTNRGRGKTSQTPSIADMFSSQFSSNSPAKRRKMTFESDSD